MVYLIPKSKGAVDPKRLKTTAVGYKRSKSPKEVKI
jgi:hypothetical protein